MSRLGDQIRAERLRKCISAKEVAKKCGLTENFILDVESGNRIINDDIAGRILKYLGILPDKEEDMPVEMQTPNERRPTLPSPSEQIAKWLDEKEEADENPLRPAPQPRVRRRGLNPAPRTFDIPPHPDIGKASSWTDTYGDNMPETQVEVKTQAQISEAWLDALSGVLKRVPVLNSAGIVIDHHVMPVQDGKIDGFPPDKVLFFKADDDEMSGFRMRTGDLVLITPHSKPVDDRLMLLNIEGFYCVRKVRKIEGNQVLLSSFDRDQRDVLRGAKSVGFIGLCTRIMITLPSGDN